MAEGAQKRKQFFYLPEVHNFTGEITGGAYQPGEPVPEPQPEPEPVPGIYPCPCCGYLTLPVPKEEAIAFICPVCFWENDIFDPAVDAPSDENHGMTLRKGRENFRKYGAVRPDFVPHVRPPLQEEFPKLNFLEK